MDRYRYRDDDRWNARRDWDDDQDRVFNRGYPTGIYGGYRGPGRRYRNETAYGAGRDDYGRGWDWHGRDAWERERWESRDRDPRGRGAGMGERIRRGWDRFTDRMMDFGNRDGGYDRDRGWEPRDRDMGRDREAGDYDRGRRYGRDFGYDRDMEYGRDHEIRRGRAIGPDRGAGYDRDADYDRASYSARDYGYDREPRYGRDRDDYAARERAWLSSNRRGGWNRGGNR